MNEAAGLKQRQCTQLDWQNRFLVPFFTREGDTEYANSQAAVIQNTEYRPDSHLAQIPGGEGWGSMVFR